MLPERIAVRTKVVWRGTRVCSEVPIEIQEDDGAWRPFRRPAWTFELTVRWLFAHGYVFEHCPAASQTVEGITTHVYRYRLVK